MCFFSWFWFCEALFPVIRRSFQWFLLVWGELWKLYFAQVKFVGIKTWPQPVLKFASSHREMMIYSVFSCYIVTCMSLKWRTCPSQEDKILHISLLRSLKPCKYSISTFWLSLTTNNALQSWSSNNSKI